MPLAEWQPPCTVLDDSTGAEDFTRYQVLAKQAGGIPTRNLSDHRIRLDSELATAVLDWARRYSNLG